jgi:hypothetical protein
MNTEIRSLEEWQQHSTDFASKTIPLTLFQTYKEWLSENPEGFVSCDSEPYATLSVMVPAAG